MTIALAIRESDGIVMAADTLESTDYIKGNESKIVTVYDPMTFPGVCAVAGAGDAGYIDAFTREIAHIFTHNPSVDNEKLYGLFGDHLKEFHKDHIIPFLELPYNERPSIEMLMGVYRDAPTIFATDRTTIRVPLRPYMAIGMGADFANILLKRFWKPSNVGAAEILAAYIVFRVKEAVETCGNYTNIVTLTRSEGTFKDGSTKIVEQAKNLPMSRIESIERDFRVWWNHAEHELLWEKIKEWHPIDHVTQSNP